MDNNHSMMSRRRFAAGFALGSVALALPLPSAALTLGDARSFIDKAVGEINRTIDSGKSTTAMFADFERIFARYADVPAIAQKALGPRARSATKAQMAAFTKAFQGYISRKYGSRFREFIGGKIEVTDAKPLKSYFEVISVAHLKGQAPLDVRWHVSDKAGRILFFNIIIEGVNMLASEQAEVGAMLDRRKGDIDALIKDLKTA